MSKSNRIREILTDEENGGILYDNMYDALMGIFRTQYGTSLGIYSYVKYTELLINKQGMSEEDAVQYADKDVYKGIVSAGLRNPLIIDDTGV